MKIRTRLTLWYTVLLFAILVVISVLSYSLLSWSLTKDVDASLLTVGEIVGQVCAVLRDQTVNPPQDRINLVFMGMGEPFLNYENCMKAVRLLVEGVGIPEGRMTLSTAGIVPRIVDFGLEPMRPKLAISLNASNDEMRTRLMPLNRKWNLQMLTRAARDFPSRKIDG